MDTAEAGERLHERRPPFGRSGYGFGLAVGAVLLAWGAGALGSVYSDWVHAPLHSALEMAGAAAGLFLAHSMRLRWVEGDGSPFAAPVAAGLASMAVLDGLHSMVHLGNGFIYLHSLSALVGGLTYGLSWLPQARLGSRTLVRATAFALGAGLVTLVSTSATPVVIVQGELTAVAWGLNLVGGTLLLSVAGRLWYAYRASGHWVEALYSLHCFVWGCAALAFPLTRLWGPGFWAWHGVRLGAYGLELWLLQRARVQMLKAGASAGPADPTQARLAFCLEAVGVGVWEYHIAAARFTWNPVMSEIYGVEPSSADGSVDLERWSSRIEPESLTRLGPHWHALLVDGTPLDALMYIRRDGERRMLRSRAQAMVGDNGQRTIVGVNWDVTEEVAAKAEIAALCESLEVRNRALNEIASVSETTLAGELTYVNDKFVELCGYSREELIGQSHELLSSGRHPPEFFRAMWTQILQGQLWEGEICNRAKDGHLYWVRTWIIPRLASGGEIECFVSIRIDITERKELEEHLLEARQEAESALRAKGEFLANMSHEIRTPMNGILGAADLMLLTESQEEQRELAQLIQRSGRSLMVIIDDILDYSKIEAGRLVLESVPVNLRQLVQEAVSLFRTAAVDKGLDLLVEVSSTGPEAFVGDPTRLRQVLLNLLSNAIKFTRRGHVAVRANYERAGQDWLLRLVVADTGIGMNAEQLERVFQRFAQADSSTTRNFGGTGLGTSISRGLVELMGGALTATSVVDEGSAFVVELTVRECVFKEERVEASAGLSERLVGKVLLVEDNVINQRIGVKMLAKLGLEVVVCENGAEALERVPEVLPDLILMDIQMPVMDGLEAARRLLERGVQTPIIAMTANVMQHDVESYQQHGMRGVVPKPFRRDEMVAVLKEHLQSVGVAPQAEPPVAVEKGR